MRALFVTGLFGITACISDPVLVTPLAVLATQKNSGKGKNGKDEDVTPAPTRTPAIRGDAIAFCESKGKRLPSRDEWTAATIQTPAGLYGVSGPAPAWALAAGGLVTADLSTPVPGFRCARDR